LERGEPIHRWSKKEPKDSWLDPDSYMAGGVSYYKRSYENLSIEQHGYYRCHDNQTAKKTDGKLDCSEGGDEVVVIRWTKRTCSKAAGLGQMVPAGSGGVAAGDRGTDKGETEAGKEAKAGGSPEGDGQSAPFGEKFWSGTGEGEQDAATSNEVTRQDVVKSARVQRGERRQAGKRGRE
jgi:hypothetical protein